MSPVSAIAPAESTKPTGWLWSQEWRDVLFAHWRLPAKLVEPHLPPVLELDLWEDSAWVSAVAFNLETRRFGVSLSFPELNLRTYVRRGDEHAVLFLSLHAGHRLGVALAKSLTPLPYYYDRINCARTSAARRFEFTSSLFKAECRLGPDFHDPEPGSLTEWLLERYVGYTTDRRKQLYRVGVNHPRWVLRGGALEQRDAQLGSSWGFDLSSPPDAWQFSDGMTAKVTNFKRVE